MSHVIYVKLTDHVNKVTYEIEAPTYANFDHPAFESGELSRFYTKDVNHLVKTRASIADMVDMVDKVIQFKILRSNDIIEIYMYLNQYMLELERYVKTNKQAGKYYPKCTEFKRMLDTSIRILANQGIRKAVDMRTKYEFINLLNLTGE